ncbi:hypothetical protein [Adhaeribacter soli]|uniref:Uncharacterized protein n=1 Tax=Adhaeribacter soli TaxID=2607655 RepID=A0A5N1IML6_9BACT|nr:hypothetical protein [Adhaeribacter soli]KAA9325041.1 hypothetical protein F0P94_19240 [Adhaeribacter soli]
MLNISLKTNPDQLLKSILERSIPLDQVGLRWLEYQQLVKEDLMPWPNQLKEGVLLTLSEAAWLKMVHGLKSCNFSEKVISSFNQRIMREVWYYESEESFNSFLTDGQVVTSLDHATQNITSFFLLDLIILELLKDKRDTKLQFNQDGRLLYSHNLVETDQRTMNGPVVSFSLYRLLVELIGKANVPALATFLAEVTTAEAEVLNAIRQPQNTSVLVEKPEPGSKHVWDIVTKEVGTVTDGEAEYMRKEVKQNFGRLVLDGMQSSLMPFELYRRTRCR